MKSDRELTGIGGWLILVGIGVTLNPIRLLFTLGSAYTPIFTNGTWEAIVTPTSEFYRPPLAALLIGEIVSNVAFIVVASCLVYFYYSKHWRFPRIFIGFVLFNILFQLVDAILVTMLFPELPLFDEQTGPTFAATLITAFIWVPYMLQSRRVRLTFTQGRASDEHRVAA